MSAETKQSKPQNWTTRFVTIFSVIFGLFFIVNASGILELSGIYLPAVPRRAVYLIGLLLVVFLQHKKGYRLTWYNGLLIAAALVSIGYIALFMDRIYKIRAMLLPLGTFEIVMCFLTVFTLIEAVRRKVGLVVALIVLFFFFYPTFADIFPGILYSRSFNLRVLTIQIYLGENGMFGSLQQIAVTLVFMFVMFGSFLQVTGAGDWFIRLALSLVGHMTGGAAKAAVAASALFGTISGSAVSNAATVGMLTIPLMKRGGYTPSFAGGVEAAAGTGGQIMPPVMGAVAFLIADWLGITYWEVCVAAFLPALLYFLAIFIMVHEEANRLSIRTIPRAELPKLIPILKEGWYWLLPLVLLVAMLGGFNLPAEKAAFWALLLIVILSMVKKKTRMTLPKLVQGLKGGLQANLTAGLSIFMVGIIIGALNLTGVGLKLSGSIVDMAGGNLAVLLLLTGLVCFILGLGMPAIPAYVMVVTFVAPALVKIGILPLAAHLFVFYWAMLSFITPPEAAAAFVAAGIAEANPMIVSLQACRLALIAYIVPFAFIYDPALIMRGSPGEIAVAFVFACIGTIALGWGAIGYVWEKVNWFSRLLLVLGGGILLFPGGWVRLAGLAAVVLVLMPQIYGQLKRSKDRRVQSI